MPGPGPVKRMPTAIHVRGGAEEARSSAQFLGCLILLKVIAMAAPAAAINAIATTISRTLMEVERMFNVSKAIPLAITANTIDAIAEPADRCDAFSTILR